MNADLKKLADAISNNQKEMLAIEQQIVALNQELVTKRDRGHNLLIAHNVLCEIKGMELSQISINENLEIEPVSTNLHNELFVKVPKIKTKNLIINILSTQGPLTRQNFVERAQATGVEVNGSTIGSTLSRMVSEGVLKKDDKNRYSVKNSTPAPPSYSGVVTSEKFFTR